MLSGVELFSGGSVTNQSGGVITGSSVGIYLNGGGRVTNNSGGMIQGLNDVGVAFTRGAGTLDNSGQITGGGTYSGVQLFVGGEVTNQSGGTITGATVGIYLNGGGVVTNRSDGTISGVREAGVAFTRASGTLLNAGDISGGGTDAGVQLFVGGTITNDASGTIASTSGEGVYVSGGTGTLTNIGTIAGGLYGVLAVDGAVTNRGTITSTNGPGIAIGAAGGASSVTNGGPGIAGASALIEGIGGIVANGLSSSSAYATTIVNWGSLAATTLPVLDVLQGGPVTLTEHAQAHLGDGTIEVTTGAVFTLDLPADTAAGHLDLGAIVGGTSGPGAITIDVAAGGKWSVPDSLSLPSSTINVGSGATFNVTGTLSVDAQATIDASGTIGGGGTISLGSFSLFSIAGAVPTNHIEFGTAATLDLLTPGGGTGTISNFTSGDTIDLQGLWGLATVTHLPGTGTLEVSPTFGSSFALTFVSGTDMMGFNIGNDGHGGISITHS
jgi:hypothetical protein